MKVVKANGGPDDLVQMVRNGSVETTQELMKVVDVVVATGGGAMVKSAYSSGRPSFGVGAGNVPVIIDRDVDLKDAAEKIVNGASFDNGIICSHEQFVLTPEEQYDETIKSFEATGKVWFTDDKEQVQKLRDVVFPGGHLNKDVVGRSAARDRRDGRHRRAGNRAHHPAAGRRARARRTCWRKEKLCPVVAILPYKTFEEAVAAAPRPICWWRAPAIRPRCTPTTKRTSAPPASSCRSAGWSSTSRASLTAGGSLTNGFAPTTTLGCGSWGGNSISENLDYKHLMNVSRIGKVITEQEGADRRRDLGLTSRRKDHGELPERLHRCRLRSDGRILDWRTELWIPKTTLACRTSLNWRRRPRAFTMCPA